MRPVSFCLFVSAFFAIHSQANADFYLSLDAETSRLVLHGSQEEIVGIDLQSDSGFLVPGPSDDSSPFEFSLVNTNTQIAYGSLGRVSISGEVALPAGWHPEQHAEFSPDNIFAQVGLAMNGGLNEQLVEDVSVVPFVPEPSSGLLACLSLLSALFLRRRATR